MKTLHYNGHTVKIYTGIEELPVVWFQAYNKALMIDAGIGSDAEAVDSHLGRAIRFLQKKNTLAAAKELQNLKNTLHFITENTNPALMSFAALVAEIDGKPQIDKSDDGLKATVELLASTRAPISTIWEWIGEVKKKLRRNWRFSFRAARKTRAKRSST